MRVLMLVVVAAVLAGCGDGAGQVTRGGEEAAPVVVEDAGDSNEQDPSQKRQRKRQGGEGKVSGDCSSAFEAAHNVDEMNDTHEDLFPAFDACRSLAEFTAASERWPDALDGADPAIYIPNVCSSYPEIADSRMCRRTG